MVLVFLRAWAAVLIVSCLCFAGNQFGKGGEGERQGGMGCGLAAGKVAGRTTGLDGLGKVPGVGKGHCWIGWLFGCVLFWECEDEDSLIWGGGGGGEVENDIVA